MRVDRTSDTRLLGNHHALDHTGIPPEVELAGERVDLRVLECEIAEDRVERAEGMADLVDGGLRRDACIKFALRVESPLLEEATDLVARLEEVF